MNERFERRVAELLDDARHAAARHDRPAVRALAESVLALDPENEDARILLDESRLAGVEEGEWRQLTVMFSDVVGSTRLAAEHDPEVYREALRAYQEIVNTAVRRYDGHVAQFLGDGVLAYFGYPTPHEDDPRRAVKAGLDVRGPLGALGASMKERHGVGLAVRVAIHTGMVIRAEMGAPTSPEHDAVVGETPNVAARLQDHAPPGGLVISEDTHRLVRGYFEVEPLGSLELRGVPRPVDAYEVLGETPGTSRIEAQAELSPFVDRDDERERLRGLWREVLAGGSQVAILRGEPGIGKSRLLEAVIARVRIDQGSTFPFRCSTFHATTHLYPARRMVADVCGIDPASGLDEAPSRLREALGRCGLEHHLSLFGALVGVPPGPDFPGPELDGQMLREATLAALLEWIEAEAARSAGALIVDDVQWADPSTIELLNRVISRRATRVLVLLASRDEFEAPWSSIEAIELGPLAPLDLEGIAAASPAASRMAAADLERLARRSDGVPLYFEELLRLEEQPSGGPAPRLASSETAIPPALLDPLLARIAAPGIELGLIQTLACIGQEVRHDLLAAVVDLPDQELRLNLAALADAGLLKRTASEPPIYHFHHHLLRELAYETQLTPARAQRHSRIADALRDRAPGAGSTDAGLLAQHLEQAGRLAEAIEAFVAAARDAQADGAFAEATEVLDHALELVEEIGDPDAQRRLELTVRRARGFSAVATLGYAAPDAAREHERCLELCRMLEPGTEHLPDLIAVWSYYVLKGDLDRADDVIAADRGRVGAPDEPPNELFTGFNRFFRGDFDAAHADHEAYLASGYGRRPGTHPAWPLPSDPTATSWALLALTIELRGEPDRAAEAIAAAKARAMALPFPWGPFSQAFVGAYACLLAILVRDYPAADAEVTGLLAVSERHGFVFFTLYGQLQRAIATLRPGGSADLDTVDQALALWRMVGADLWLPGFLTEIAEHRLRRGDLDGAREFIRDAEAITEQSGARYWAAETTRVRGECRLAAGDAGGADDLRAAADLAARQGAVLFERRAQTALSERRAV